MKPNQSTCKRKHENETESVLVEDDLLQKVIDDEESSDEEDLEDTVGNLKDDVSEDELSDFVSSDEEIHDNFDELNLSDDDLLENVSETEEDSDDDSVTSNNDGDEINSQEATEKLKDNDSSEINYDDGESVYIGLSSKNETNVDAPVATSDPKNTKIKVSSDKNYIITNRPGVQNVNTKLRRPRRNKQKVKSAVEYTGVENVSDGKVNDDNTPKETDLINSETVKVKKRNKVNNPKIKKVVFKNDQANENEINNPTSDVNNGEYQEDSSDEEDLRNTIGNVPINWYDEYPHLGYGLDSLPIMKPLQRDKLEEFLEKMENPDYFRTVFDKQTGQQVKLSDEHLDFISRVMNHKVPNASHDLFAPFLDLYSHDVSEMPLSGRPDHKRSFIPSKAERQEVVRLASLIKRGLLRRRKIDLTNLKIEEPKYYDIWRPRTDDEEKIRHISDHIPAPKMPLPGHQDSYNPPPEYLVNRHDEMALKGMKTDEDRGLFEGFWRKFNSIREIPGYPKFVKERFERLMDLYLTPRKRYKKIIAKSSDFLPSLPDKKDLRPYPTMEEVIFKGHRSIIRTISIHPGGKYVASGSDDHTVRIWEISTGRCLRTFEVEEAPKTVSWNPNSKLFLVAVAMGRMVVFLNPENHLTDKLVVQQTNSIFKEEVDQGNYIVPEKIKDAVNWRKPTEQEYANGYRLVLDHFKEVKQIVWHKQGDYFATVIPEGDHRSVLMHQLSRWRSQVPFSKNKGRVQTVAFHPKLPQLFVVTQSHIRVYDLQKQGLLKKIQGNSRWMSCIDVHPGGEHFVIGGYDRRVNWFEMEYTKRPHLMRYHIEAVRSIKFHRKYPLYASCSDDGRLVVSYGMVYEDWLKDPLIVPLKQLKGHKKFDDLYVLDLAWHPYEPYLLSAGADATIRLWH